MRLSVFKILDKNEDHTHCQYVNADINAKTWFQEQTAGEVKEKFTSNDRFFPLENFMIKIDKFLVVSILFHRYFENSAYLTQTIYIRFPK